MENHAIAQRLMAHARLLESESDNLFRVRAYRRAAATVETLARPVVELIAKEGSAGLKSMPGIGAHLSFTIAELVRTGEFRTAPSRTRSVSRN
jgi:DNA polymerase/3'-5' exonuclease PolX